MSLRSKLTVVYLLGFALDLINMFIASVAYPDMGRGLGASLAQLAWVGNAYMLGLTLVIPLSAWLAGAYGERRVLLGSLALFLAGAALAGTAPSIEALIGWRALQGLGGGLLIPVGQAMVYRHYPPALRARLTALIMGVALIVPALSPALGGVIVDALSWRWTLLASAPLALLTLWLAARWLPADQTPARRGALDLSGLALLATGMASLLLALTWLGESGQQPRGVAALLLAVAALAGYARAAAGKAEPVLKLTLLRGRLLRTAMLVYLFVPGVFMGVSLAAMLYLQEVLKLSAAAAGGLMLPWALASALAISLTRGRFNHGGPKPLLLLGMLFQSAGIALLALGVRGPWPLIAAYAMMGFGGSLCSSAAQSAAFLDIAESELRQASALWNINRQFSFGLGVALISLLLNALTHYSGAPTAGAQVYQACFFIAAGLTLAPAVFVLRIHTPAVLALLRPSH
ncbi:MFS transporter [Chromobacterium alkanivorans]|uniref:MFS transporter n=1 Tax=Chromobacterium alkanivorans TaxID=1071719 RepID=UPI00196760A9|nr:MFS transporter [Chromobacterium alkanivorans]MBN3005449.1 MFS transporter [Chromobacterium alkanivorans]